MLLREFPFCSAPCCCCCCCWWHLCFCCSCCYCCCLSQFTDNFQALSALGSNLSEFSLRHIYVQQQPWWWRVLPGCWAPHPRRVAPCPGFVCASVTVTIRHTRKYFHDFILCHLLHATVCFKIIFSHFTRGQQTWMGPTWTTARRDTDTVRTKDSKPNWTKLDADLISTCGNKELTK